MVNKNLVVKTLNGKTLNVEINEDDGDVDILKEKIFQMDPAGLPVAEMKLVCCGKMLAGRASDWGIKDGNIAILLPDLKDPTGASTEVELDLVFVVDCTGSMGSYIAQAKAHITAILEEIISSEKASVQFALVKYKDLRDEYATQVSPFTDDVNEAKKYVDTMSAGGGGDAPECVTSGLEKTLSLVYRDSATKVCVLIADAPPHGLEASGDTYPEGDPCMDLLAICRQYVPMGIRFYCVGCEPAICGYKRSCSWMKWAAELTGGRYVSLAAAKALADVIVGGCREQLNRDKFKNHVLSLIGNNVQKSAVTEETCAGIAEKLNKTGFRLLSVHFSESTNQSIFEFVHVFDIAETLKHAKKLCENPPKQSDDNLNKQEKPQTTSSSSSSGVNITTVPVTSAHVRNVLQ